MLKYIAGRSLNPRPGEIGVKFEEAFDLVSQIRIKHTSECIECRRLWSTLSFRPALACGQCWPALVGEFLKILASSGVHSKFSFRV